MGNLNKIDVIILSLTMLLGAIIAVVGLVLNRDLFGLSTLILAVITPVVGGHSANRISEWRARAADSSSLVDQEGSIKKTQTPPTP